MQASMSLADSTGLLVVRAAKLHRGVVARHLTEVGLHVGQELLLLELAGSDGLSQRELSERLGVEQATVAVALRRLEAAGFVERHTSPNDGRVRNAVLTGKGEGVLADIHAAWDAAEQALTGPLTERQIVELRRSLAALHDHTSP